MKLLVIGRTGQVASSLAELAKGREGIAYIAVGRAEADLEMPGAIAAAIRAATPDLVINAAGYTDVDGAEEEADRAFRVNADAAGEAAQAAKAIGAPIIQLSTDYVFDGRAGEPYREDAPTNPLGAYGRSKLAGEEAVRAASGDHLILRTAWIYSPFGRNFVKTMFDAGERKDRVRVVDDQRGNPTSALDLAEALFVIVDRFKDDRLKLGRTYHLAGSGNASWYEVACEVMVLRGQLGLKTAEIDRIGSADWPAKAVRPAHSLLDCSAFERDFGIRLPDWRHSVGRTVKRLADRTA